MDKPAEAMWITAAFFSSLWHTDRLFVAATAVKLQTPGFATSRGRMTRNGGRRCLMCRGFTDRDFEGRDAAKGEARLKLMEGFTGMRWEGLFADLEAQAETLAAAERAAEIEERTRSETARLTAADRLRGSIGTEVRLSCQGNLTVQGQLTSVQVDCVLLSEPHGRETLVALNKLLSVGGLSRLAETDVTNRAVATRLGLPFLLRRIARDRSGVRIQLVERVVSGTIDRVGANFIEVAIHPQGEARRRTAVVDVVLVPIAAIVALSRDAVD